MVGGGYIGVELGTAYARLGSKVTIVEATDRILGEFDDDSPASPAGTSTPWASSCAPASP